MQEERTKREIENRKVERKRVHLLLQRRVYVDVECQNAKAAACKALTPVSVHSALCGCDGTFHERENHIEEGGRRGRRSRGRERRKGELQTHNVVAMQVSGTHKLQSLLRENASGSSRRFLSAIL
jgi:hypothetical protein